MGSGLRVWGLGLRVERFDMGHSEAPCHICPKCLVNMSLSQNGRTPPECGMCGFPLCSRCASPTKRHTPTYCNSQLEAQTFNFGPRLWRSNGRALSRFGPVNRCQNQQQLVSTTGAKQVHQKQVTRSAWCQAVSKRRANQSGLRTNCLNHHTLASFKHQH